MSIVSRTGDLFYAFRFIKLLVTDWKDTKAFDFGIIDDNGKVLRKAKTLKDSDEKAAYTVFHRLVFNIKRLLSKLPFGKTRLASYAAALFLIKEHTGVSENKIKKAIEKFTGEEINWDEVVLGESSDWFLQEDESLRPGIYTLAEEVVSPETGEVIGTIGSTVKVEEGCHAVDTVLGSKIFKVNHLRTRQDVYITNKSIKL